MEEDDIDMDTYVGGGGEEFFPKLVHLEDEDYSSENYYSNGMETSAEHSRYQAAAEDGGNDGQDDDVYYERISMSELLDQCVIPTFSQAVNTVYPLLALCLLSRAVNIFCAKGNRYPEMLQVLVFMI